MKRLLALVFLVCAAHSALAQFEHPDLKSGKKQVSSIVVMPVQAEITKVGMKGPEPMEAESRQVEKSLAPILSEVLRKLGCTVQDTAFTSDAFEKDVELRYTVNDLQKQFDAVLGQMTKKSKDVRKGRFTIGDSVAKLPSGADSDALLFVRATGQVLTGGKKAFGWLVTGQGV